MRFDQQFITRILPEAELPYATSCDNVSLVLILAPYMLAIFL